MYRKNSLPSDPAIYEIHEALTSAHNTIIQQECLAILSAVVPLLAAIGEVPDYGDANWGKIVALVLISFAFLGVAHWASVRAKRLAIYIKAKERLWSFPTCPWCETTVQAVKLEFVGEVPFHVCTGCGGQMDAPDNVVKVDFGGNR
jgi:hypothetical protein